MKTHDFLPSRRRSVCLVLAVGAVTLCAGVADERSWATGARYVGAVLLAAGAARWAVRPLFISLRDLYASAHQQGYENGYQDGRRIGHPVLVNLDDYRRVSPGVDGPAATSEPG